MTAHRPDHDMLALGIRQPWAELILRGVKTIEVRSQDTKVRGPIYVYSSKKFAEIPEAAIAAKRHELDLESLPRGVIVGTVEIVDSFPCRRDDAKHAAVPQKYLEGKFAWRLANPRRLSEPLAVRFLPYGMWFYPFKRRQG